MFSEICTYQIKALMRPKISTYKITIVMLSTIRTYPYTSNKATGGSSSSGNQPLTAQCTCWTHSTFTQQLLCIQSTKFEWPVVSMRLLVELGVYSTSAVLRYARSLNLLDDKPGTSHMKCIRHC